MKYLTKSVWILAVVSLFQDICSEMLYPVMPIYLSSIGFSIALIGILEGFAESTIGISKGYFGKQSDLSGKRLPFIQWGYALTVIGKTMMVLIAHPVWVFFTRSMDRLGKGIRTGARDAMLSDEASPENKGKIFGFHRSLDTLGAVIGPLLALVYLYYYPEDYKTLFFLAFAPGMMAVALTFLLKDKSPHQTTKKKWAHPFSFFSYWKAAPVLYRRVLIGLLIFALVNSSDLFLILRLKETGMSDTWVIGGFIFYNLIYALFSFPLGVLADKIGLKKIFIFGLCVFVAVYLGMAFELSATGYLILFGAYGIFSAATEGVAKAWISNIAERKDTATAIGLYSGLQSVCTFLASSITGIVWYAFGAATAFIATAIVVGGVVMYMITVKAPEE